VNLVRPGIGEISLATWSFSSATISCAGLAFDSRMTKAEIAWPVYSSVAPTTAASATCEWPTSADSTSAVEMRCPETFITSSMRPTIQMLPSRS